MKSNLLRYLILILTCGALNIQSKAQNTEVLFKSYNYNFGELQIGDTVSFYFEFKNIGKLPLIIENTTTTCGCTIAERPQLPIKPKGKGEIKVQFIASEKGVFTRSVSVFMNTKTSPVQLKITGKINE